MSIYIGILHVIIELVKKIPESNLSLHRGVWKNSYFWSIHTELMKIDMNLRSWVLFVFFNHTLPNNIKTRITAWEVVLKKALFALYVFLIIPMWSKKSMPSTSFVHWIYFSHQIKLEIWYIRICGLPILSNIDMCVGVFLQGTISTLSMLRFLISMILRVYYTWTVNVRDWVSACL